MKKIGILGGLGPESTVAYYEYITRKYYEKYGNYRYPEIIIYSVSFEEFIDQEYKMADKVKNAIISLHQAGADFVVAACNSVHIVYEQVVDEIPIPWISIIDATAEEIQKGHLKKVGLLGTIFTMSKDFYKKGLLKREIEAITPDGNEQKKINEIIYQELVLKKIKDSSRRGIQEIIKKLERKGAEGIILACTELPFPITQKNTSLRVFDTTEIHAQKALNFALGI